MFEEQFIENPPEPLHDPTIEKWINVIGWILFIILTVITVIKSK
jgi:hypothetical protein